MKEQMIPLFFDETSARSTQYTNTIQGIRSAASKYGLRLHMISESDADLVNFQTIAPVSIITSPSMPFIHKILSKLKEHHQSAVLAGTDSEQFGHDISCATPSRRTETQQLVNYLYSCGKKKLALVGFGKNSINDNFRYHAAMSAVAARGRPLTNNDVWLWLHDPYESFETFLDVYQKYDAVICPNDIMAIGLIDCCKARGIKVPDDIFVASFGNMAIGRFYHPSITSMTMDMLCVGEQAFYVWRFIINNPSNQKTALKITVPSRILVRESTANVNLQAGEGTLFPPLQADRFYFNPTISILVNIEGCISQRDEVDMQIIRKLFDAESYEQIADDLFISGSTLRYRLNKIFADAGVHSRQEFELLIRNTLGSQNPFASV